MFEDGKLLFRPAPVLSKSFFSTNEQCTNPFGFEETLPAVSAACALLGTTLLVYINPTHQDTFGDAAVRPCRYQLHGRDGSLQTVEDLIWRGKLLMRYAKANFGGWMWCLRDEASHRNFNWMLVYYNARHFRRG